MNTNDSMKEKILNWCLPAFYIIGILGVVITGTGYYNEIQKQKERLLAIDKILEVEEVGTKIQLDLNKQNKEEVVVFEVDDSSVVKVDESGELTSVGKGTTTVTVTNKDNSKTQTFVVGVGKDAIEELKDYKEKVDELIEQNKVELPSKNEYSDKENNKLEESQPTTPEQEQTPTVIKVTGIKLNKTAVTLEDKKTTKLTTTISPANATNKNVIWESSDTSLVTVDSDGNIKAVGNKNALATITVTTEDGKYKDTVVVTVKVASSTVKVTNVKLDKSSLTLTYGKSTMLTATVLPTNATNKDVEWKSSNASLVMVDTNGNIKAVGNEDAKATITVTTKDGKYSASATVTVKAVSNVVKVTGIQLDKSSLTLTYGKSTMLTATVLPTNATNKNVVWKSNDLSLVTVDASGNIKAVGNRSAVATITATTADGKYSASVTVTVKEEGIKINQGTEGTIYLNSSRGNPTKGLTVVSLSTNNVTKDVTWSSDNPRVAVVDSNGKVIAKGLGLAKIKASTKDGKYTATYKLTVKQKVIVVITASAGYRMQKWVTSYTSKNNYYYFSSNSILKKDDNGSYYTEDPGDGTLKYVFYSGKGYTYQTGAGTTKTINNINNAGETYKKYSEFSIFYTLTGNTAKNYTCSQIETGTEHKKQLMSYREAIKKFKNSGINCKFYMLSHFPLNTRYGFANYRDKMEKSKIVYSTDENACNTGYRSGIKYWKSNKTMSEILGRTNDMIFINGFNEIVELENETTKKFNWKTAPNGQSYVELYKTTDGLHQDESTTKFYMPIVFNLAGM